jgi:adenosylhomocysteine nucleosidase
MSTVLIETLITVPQPNELDLILAAFDGAGYPPRSSTIGRLECHLVDALALLFTVGGHGKTQHAVQTQHLIEQRPTIRAVICAGAAGSLGPDLTAGAIVVGLSTVEHDYKLRFVQRPLPRHDADMRLADEFRLVAGRIGSRFKMLFGEIASGDEDVVDSARAAELRRATGALCVAWEGAGAARAARFSRLPFLELRAITDSADHAAPGDFNTNLKISMPNLAQVLLSWSLLRGTPGG